MKGIPKVTRVQLRDDNNDDQIIFGLVSSDPDYKLSLALNRKLGLAMKSVSPITIAVETNKEESFSRFSDTSEAPDIVYTLVSNRCGSNFLIKKLRNVDFLLIARNEDTESMSGDIAARIKEIGSITAVFIVDLNTTRDKNLKYLI